MAFDPIGAISLLVTAILAAFCGVLMLVVLQKRHPGQINSIFKESFSNTEYLFDGEVLLDATPSARKLLPKVKDRNAAVWPRLMTFLEQHFPNASAKLIHLQTDGTFMLSSIEGSLPALLLRAELRGGLTRISLIDVDKCDGNQNADPMAFHAAQKELEMLRNTTAHAPLPIWRESINGEVFWANSTYLELASAQLADDKDLTWPLQRLFSPVSPVRDNQLPRQKLPNPAKGNNQWFELSGFDDPGGGRLMFAQPIDALVRAEVSLGSFMQTLTKTFAYLSTGLAIFDESRKLVLFNPAMMELTNLPADMLSSRPSLIAFFDALREGSMIPEPRNYRSWRNQITNLEKAAASGLYEEVWSLPAGQTYRVTGRPHPNGALALSIEDISTEITQTRRYRADLELGQAVVDAMEEAIAVFSASGLLVMSNAAYTEIWGHDPAGKLAGDGGVIAVCDYWRQRSAPSTIWDRVEDFAAATGERPQWQDDMRMTDGRLVHCRFVGLAGGSMLAAFRLLETAKAPDTALRKTRKTA